MNLTLVMKIPKELFLAKALLMRLAASAQKPPDLTIILSR